MIAVRCVLETHLLPRLQAVLAHQTSYSMPSDYNPFFSQFNMHTRTIIGFARQGKVIADVRQNNHIIKVEIAGQLIRRQFARKAPIVSRLIVAQETDRQGRQACAAASRFVERRACNLSTRSRGLPLAST